MGTTTIVKNEIRLSKEQEAAVHATDSTLVVSAAAGSGKTRVLVERYLKHIVKDGLRPDQILTITFTRKAAAEMKRRIVDRLTELGLAEDAQIAETGPIQTIHGFCERLLRENSLAAGLDPEFEILSEGQAGRLREKAISEALADPPEDSPEAEALIAKLAGKRTYLDSMSPHGRLEQAVRSAMGDLRGTGLDPSALERMHRNPLALQRQWRDNILSKIPPDVRGLFEDDRSGDNFAVKLTTAFKSLKRAKPRWVRPSVESDIESAADTCGLVQLVCSAWQIFESEMRRAQTLDFTLLEAEAVRLVSQSEQVGNRVRSQYPVVLIDEAQDLNPMQYRLLSAIRPVTEMFVGDLQQSIYGFRQADPRQFQSKSDVSPSVRLSHNYRSEEGVLGFVDAFFSALWTEYIPMLDTRLMAFPGVEFWGQRQRDSDLVAQWVAELLEERRLQGGDGRDIAVLVRSSKYAMELLAKLERHNVKARVAGGTEQFYARLEVRDLANALEAVTDPYDDFALAALLRSPFAGLSLDSIVLLAKNSPIVDALEVFTSPVAEDNNLIQQFLAWFRPLSTYADRLAAWEAISELFAKTPYLENIGRRQNASQLLANVRKLLSLATSESELTPREFAARIREIQEIRHKEGDAPASDQDADEITIMTIHKSKGLEFPVVVLPDTFQKLTKQSKDIEIDPDMPMVTTKFGAQSSMFHEWVGSLRQSRELEEEWRVLYVAMTRAKERLCVLVNPGGGGDQLAQQIWKLSGCRDAPPPGVHYREASNLQH